MKMIMVSWQGIEEVNVKPSEFFRYKSLDCISLEDGIDAWVHDDALLSESIDTVSIGTRQDIPLPAYLFGSEGEKTIDCPLGIDTVRGMVRYTSFGMNEPFDLTNLPPDLPAIGIDVRRSKDGRATWAWRAVLAFPGSSEAPQQFLSRLPTRIDSDDTEHPIFGDLRNLHCVNGGRAALIDIIKSRGLKAIKVSSAHPHTNITNRLAGMNVYIKAIDLEPFPADVVRREDVAHLEALALLQAHQQVQTARS